MNVDAKAGGTHFVEFFPTYARRAPDGDWLLRVQGWIFEDSDGWRWRRRFLELLRRGLRIGPGEERSAILANRVTPFLVSGAAGRVLEIEFQGERIELPPSSETGHVEATIRRPANSLDPRHTRWVEFDVPEFPPDAQFGGRVRLLEPQGLSVVSDVDDTIKHSNITVRRELLANTFLRRFEAVPGMADLYGNWLERGAAFHYVSNSPWQLTRSLVQFLDEQGFPRGSMHLRPFRVRQGGLRRFLKHGESRKREALTELLDDFPERRFALVGDSSERDPEIYGHLARERPHQVLTILIRDVTGEPVEGERFQKAFDGVPRDRWSVFRMPEAVRDTALDHA